MKHFGYWIFGRDMYNVNTENLKKNGVTDIFLNFYAFNVYGEKKVLEWIKQLKKQKINTHIWMQCFYDGEWINPVTNSRIIKEKIKEAKKYATYDEVYGVHLDYLRYPGKAYKTDGGADAITNFVKQVRKEIPKKFLSCAVMPESDTKHYYGQDIKSLGKIMDAVLPMQYKGNYGVGTSWLKSTSKDFSSKCTLWSGLQSYVSDDDTTKLTVSELSTDIKACLDNGASGVILFRYGISPVINFTKFQDKTETKTTNTTTTTSANVKSPSTNDDIVSKETIYKIAETVKEYVDKNQKIPSKVDGYTYPEYTFLLAKAIYKPNKDINKKKGIKSPSKPSGSNFNKKIQYDDYVTLAKNLVNFVNKNNTLPNYIKYGKYQVRVKVYVDAFARIVNYYHTHNNKYPSYVSITKERFVKK